VNGEWLSINVVDLSFFILNVYQNPALSTRLPWSRYQRSDFSINTPLHRSEGAIRKLQFNITLIIDRNTTGLELLRRSTVFIV